MNVSYEWLKAFVPFDQTPAQLRDLITAHVATVDELAPLRTDLAAIVVARVVEEGPHPDSDHLHVTKVDIGTGELLDVVCGAPNVTAGRLYPFAPSGTVMPDGKKIEKKRIRGALSNGMLCSPTEIGLGTDGSGLLELGDLDVPLGTPLLKVMPIGDTRIVIDVGANRPDLLSHLGIAREVAALTGKPLALAQLLGVASSSGDSSTARAASPSASLGMTTGGVSVRVDDASLINRFMGVVIRGVKVGPSPDWLKERVESVGGRSINNVVDASNYVLHELGQPTHAFDLAKLGGGSVVVRKAKAGERITTLDGTDRALGAEMIVIADASRPQAIAGIMGGRDSEVTEATTDIFLEVANFDPRRIRDARRALGMTSDASYRFERGVDVEIAPVALARVAEIIAATAGGRMDGAPTDIRRAPAERRTIALRPARVARVLGDVVDSDESAKLLQAIGFETGAPVRNGTLNVSVPSWRDDVAAEIDLIEEVARLRGYDSFPDEIRPFRATNTPDDPAWITAKRVRESLVALGLLEARPMPFVAGGDGFVRLGNPLAENEAYLRREVLDTLARRAEHNLAHMQGDIRLFEIGAVFEPSGAVLPVEEMHVGVLLMGRRSPRHFTDLKGDDAERAAQYSAWDAKGVAEVIAAAAYPGRAVSLVAPADAASANTTWSIVLETQVIGGVGRVALDAPVWAAPAWGIELSIGVVDSAQVAQPGSSALRPATRDRPKTKPYVAVPSTPASTCDLALLVPVATPARSIEDCIRRVSGDVLESVELFDLYDGPGVPDGHRSLAWRLTFRHPERTLREKEIDARRAKILSALDSELHVRQRTS